MPGVAGAASFFFFLSSLSFFLSLAPSSAAAAALGAGGAGGGGITSAGFWNLAAGKRDLESATAWMWAYQRRRLQKWPC